MCSSNWLLVPTGVLERNGFSAWWNSILFSMHHDYISEITKETERKMNAEQRMDQRRMDLENWKNVWRCIWRIENVWRWIWRIENVSRWVWRIEHVWRIDQDHTRMEICIFLFVFARFQTFSSLLVFYSTFWLFSGEGDQITQVEQKLAKTSKD